MTKYRGDIDGLRAIAVVIVVLYHFGVPGFSGGFVGVDVFFVISGYLITSILARDALEGRSSILSFYARRVRRILPALLVVISMSLIAGYALLLPGDYESLAVSAIYSAFGGGNLFFYWNTGYFDARADTQPLLHLWSLGVEEQFYLVWPIIACTILRFARRGAFAFTILATIAGFALSIYILDTNPKGAFYLAHSRAWELSIGAALALRPLQIKGSAADALTIVGLAMIAAAATMLTPSSAFPGINAAWPVVGSTIVIAAGSGAGFVRRALSIAPLRWLGLISYSLYLVHWPLIAFFRHHINGAEPTAAEITALIAASIILAYASWRWVEQPFRSHTKSRAKTVATGAFAATTVATMAAIISVNSGIPSRIPQDMLGMRSRDVMWRWICHSTANVGGKERCIFGSPWHTKSDKAFLWGDSHAEHLVTLLDAAAGERVSFLLNRECPAPLGGGFRLRIPENQDYNNNARCHRTQQEAIELLQQTPEINYVLLASAWHRIGGMIYSKDAEGLDALKRAFLHLIDQIAGDQRTIILFGDFPMFKADPIPCFAASWLWRRRCAPDLLTVSRATLEANQGPADRLLEAIAKARPNIRVLLPSRSICDDLRCESAVNGEFIYRDNRHLRRNLRPDTNRMLADRIGMPELFSPVLSKLAP